MIIKSLDIGTRIRFKYKLSKEKPMECPFCNGKGEKIINGETFFCQSCEYGTISVTEIEEVELIGEIAHIDFRNFGRKDSTNIILYNCKINKYLNKNKNNFAWCEPNDIIEVLTPQKEMD